MRRVLLALVTLLVAAPSAAHANDVRLRLWGGTAFSESDRDSQGSGDALGLAVDPGGRVVAALGTVGGDTYAYRFGPDGEQVARFRVGTAARAVAVDGTGRVFTANPSGAITRWAQNGSRESTFAAGGPVAALTVDAGGDVYAAGGSSVRRFSADGAPAGVLGGPADVGAAAGVAVDRAGDVLVADPDRRRVEVLAGGSGALVRTIGGPAAADGGLVAPTGVGVDTAGNVVVADPGEDQRSAFSIAPPPNLKRFGPGGHYQGPIDNGLDVDFADHGAPLLLAVAPQGDVYFSDNPDFVLMPEAVVRAPRLIFDDDHTLGGGEDNFLVASVGRRAHVPTRVFPSLSSNLRASVDLGPGVALARGTPASRPADVPAGKQKLDLDWPIAVTKPGRHVAEFTLSGRGPAGEPTKMAKPFEIYGVPGPGLDVLGAVYLPKARTVFVALQLNFGTVRIRDDFVLFTLDDLGDLSATLRAGKRKLPEQGFSIGGPATGACLPFSVPRGVSGTGKLKLKAAFSGTDSVNGARATRTIRPRLTVPRHGVLAGCLLSSDLAGGPTG
jgi:hypothetical protein